MEDTPGISMFQTGSINLQNVLQNQEDEDLEEQMRIQEEVKNALENGLGEFNYDDESTVNSSTNISTHDCNFEQKYRDVDMENQLKVLYEVRVEEIKNLTIQLDALKMETNGEKEALLKKFMLAEAEKESAQLSLKQAQELLISKTEHISRLSSTLETQQKSINQLEFSLETIKSERDSLKHTNIDLTDQLTIMHKGTSTKTVSDRQLQEQHHVEITKIHHNLDVAIHKVERLEQEKAELQGLLESKIHQKDELMVEKSDIINKLYLDLEESQAQNRKFLQLSNALALENKNLKETACDIDVMNKVQMGLSDKTEMIKVLQKELDKANDINSKQLVEFESLQHNYSEIHRKCTAIENEFEHEKNEKSKVISKNEILENNLKIQFEDIKKLNEKILHYGNLEMQNEILLKRIDSLQVLLMENEKLSSKERSMQVSQLMNSFCEQTDLYKDENIKLHEQLKLANDELRYLNEKVNEYEDTVRHLQERSFLVKEKEKIIENLKETASKFEKVIMEQKHRPKCVSISTNTENVAEFGECNEEMLQAQYETELIQKEILIRQELQKEFHAKLEKFYKEKCCNCLNLESQLLHIDSMLKEKIQEIEITKNGTVERKDEIACLECVNLRNRLKRTEEVLEKLNLQLKASKDDRKEEMDFIARMLDEWQANFRILEEKNIDLVSKLQISNNVCQGLENKLREVDNQLIISLQKETENLLVQTNRKTMLNLTMKHKNKITQLRKKVDDISKRRDEEVKNIESLYNLNQQSMQKMLRS